MFQCNSKSVIERRKEVGQKTLHMIIVLQLSPQSDALIQERNIRDCFIWHSAKFASTQKGNDLSTEYVLAQLVNNLGRAPIF